jgi:hypothetical protein
LDWPSPCGPFRAFGCAAAIRMSSSVESMSSYRPCRRRNKSLNFIVSAENLQRSFHERRNDEVQKKKRISRWKSTQLLISTQYQHPILPQRLYLRTFSLQVRRELKKRNVIVAARNGNYLDEFFVQSSWFGGKVWRFTTSSLTNFLTIGLVFFCSLIPDSSIASECND